jgi:hypothetical protein
MAMWQISKPAAICACAVPKITWPWSIKGFAKVNLYCAMSRSQVYGQFWFAENRVSVTEHDSEMERLASSFSQQCLRMPACGATKPLELQVKWPSCSPTLTPCHFFLWGSVKEKVSVPPVPLDYYRNCRDKWQIAWGELDYRLDIGQATNWADIEHL